MIWGLAIALGLGGLWVPGDPPWVAAAVERIAGTGWAAALLLVATLAVSPLGRARGLARARQARWRRQLGLATCALVVAHVGCVTRAGWIAEAGELLTEPNLRSGATAAVVLGMLGLTSWPRLVRGLRLGLWKPLHRAIYVAALLVAHHVALSGHADPRRVVGLGLAVLGLLGWRGAIFGLASLRALRRGARRR